MKFYYPINKKIQKYERYFCPLLQEKNGTLLKEKLEGKWMEIDARR